MLIDATLKRLLRTMALAFLFGISGSALATISTPELVPLHPVSGQMIGVRATSEVCDALLDVGPGLADVTRNGNAITILIDTIHQTNFNWCIYPSITATYEIGRFEVGSYTLQVDRRYSNVFGTTVETLLVIPFEVLPSQEPQSIPALSPLLLMVLVAGMLGLARRKWMPLALIAAFACITPNDKAHAEGYQLVELLVSTEAGAPTAEEIVNYYRNDNRSVPPLDGLRAESPVDAYYLLPKRAEGDFLVYLQNNPDSARAKLERYVIVRYPSTANIENALSALRADRYVNAAARPMPASPRSVQLQNFDVGQSPPLAVDAATQDGPRSALNIDAAWSIAGGSAFVAVVDGGLYTNHSALRQFSGATYVGGHFMPQASWDYGAVPTLTFGDPNVDELEPTAPEPSQGVACAGSNGLAVPSAAGHGTHVSGLVAANPIGGLALQGTCKNCGIAMWKISTVVCSGTLALVGSNEPMITTSLTSASDNGAQVISLSYGNALGTNNANICGSLPSFAYCEGIKDLTSKDSVLVAASGNDRVALDFPASDPRAISVGGLGANLALWDDSPGSTSNCPVNTGTAECGSNYTTFVQGQARQETVAIAKSILSTTYPGINWAVISECGDFFPGPGAGNGQGLCTGTSMSTPQVAGVVGILRSINPLVPVSAPTVSPPQKPGIRTVLAQTTAEAQLGQGWGQQKGYGRPDAAAAAKQMLGRVAGVVVKNRVTPLFRLFSVGANDYYDTITPQLALSAIYYSSSYQPQGSIVPGYSNFPQEAGTTPLPTPRAKVYVLTTEYKPYASYPSLLPLHLMGRERAFPVGCTSGQPGCNTANRDFTLMTTKTDIEQAHAAGYALYTIQGYIYQPCTPEPGCIPTGAEKLWRECKTAIDDCAIFLESERTGFEFNGYTSAFPAGSSKMLGYAYPSTDSDNDGLVDGFEYVIGTNPLNADTNGDGVSDGTQYPMAGVPVSDPCAGVGAIGFCGNDRIFRNGFEP